GAEGLAFWLAEAPLPRALEERVAQGLVLVRDAASDRFDADSSWVVLDRLMPGSPSRWFRRSQDPAQGAALWRDRFGRPPLEGGRKGSGPEPAFHGRFEPQTSELVLHPAFPEWLLDLVSAAAGTSAAPGPDTRGIDPSQRQPRLGQGVQAEARAPEPRDFALP